MSVLKSAIAMIASGSARNKKAQPPTASEGKSSRGNPVKRIGLTFVRGMGARNRAQYVEWACDSNRFYNPKRDNRHQLERHFEIKTGRQWKRLRRRLRAQYGEKVNL